MSEPVVLTAVDSRGVATVTLNRPEVNNAYDSEMIAGLSSAVSRLGSDAAVRVLVIRGNGRHFQAGADLKWLDRVRNATQDENVEVSRRTAQAVRSLNELPKPTLALVHGGCFGGGIGIIAACDVVIAEQSAVFAISEARWGVIASIIIPQLNGAMGVRQVRRYALSCERFGATRAQAFGLVHEVCADAALDETAAPIIDGFLRSAPMAMAQTKRVALEHAALTMSDEYFEALVRGHGLKRMSEEAQEGLASFREKRDPAWFGG